MEEDGVIPKGFAKTRIDGTANESQHRVSARLPVFFYGLFMDMEGLRKKALKPTNEQVVFIRDHTVSLRAKAILTSATGQIAWGILAEITDEDFEKLYGHQRDYKKLRVTATTRSGNIVAAITMVHRNPDLDAPLDPGYAKQWEALVKRLQFHS